MTVWRAVGCVQCIERVHQLAPVEAGVVKIKLRLLIRAVLQVQQHHAGLRQAVARLVDLPEAGDRGAGDQRCVARRATQPDRDRARVLLVLCPEGRGVDEDQDLPACPS